MSGRALALCSKSPWAPAIRREHALARLAAGAGHEVAFLEHPLDLRALRRSPRDYVGVLASPRPYAVAERLTAWRRGTLVPGHRDGAAERLDAAQLARALRRAADPRAVRVAMLPWQWPALRPGSARRVFELADDWRRLIPRRARHLEELHRRIGAEADEIIVVAPALAELFPGRSVVVVPNAVGDELLATPPTPPPGRRRLVYVGTLSERFDAPLMAAVMARLNDWTLDLYGPCTYAGSGDRPAPEVTQLLASTSGRARWHGIVARDRLADALDSADVLIVPNRDQARGQDSMKLYDYAARARPVAVTTASLDGAAQTPPHVLAADSADELADVILAAAAEPEGHAGERRRWAEQQTWSARWATWSDALFGADAEALSS